MRRGPASAGRETAGFYAQARYDLAPLFLVGRYGAVLEDAARLGKQLNAGVGVAVFPNAELRVEYATEVEPGTSAVHVQVAGGSAWTPTGLRR